MSDVQLEQQKDNFWMYIIIGVVIFAGAIFMVKTSGSKDYIHAQQLVKEDSSYSAYKK